MNRKLSTWLLLALIGALLLAGCGSSSSSSSSSTPATTSTAATTSSSSNPAVAAAVAGCKSVVQAASSLSAKAKSKIEGVCEKAANGDKEAARKAAQEVCEEVIKSSPLPSSSAKESALSACKKK
jgi:PBP1b-binding outer membrane lipoprotein LpoB